jgi:hypothetical protein
VILDCPSTELKSPRYVVVIHIQTRMDFAHIYFTSLVLGLQGPTALVLGRLYPWNILSSCEGVVNKQGACERARTVGGTLSTADRGLWFVLFLGTYVFISPCACALTFW